MRQNRFSKYKGFIRGNIYGVFAYRFKIWGWIAQDILTVIMTVFLWLAIYNAKGIPDGGTYQGYTLPGMVAYMMLGTLTFQWSGNSETFREVGNDVYEGTISISLTKPISYRGKMLAGAIGSMIANLLIFALPMAVLAALMMWAVFPNTFQTAFVDFQWYNIIFYFAQGILAVIILDSLDFMVAQVSFISKSVFGLMIIKATVFSFLAGGMIPYAFFGETAAKVLSITPFACLASSPINMILGRYSLFAEDIFSNSSFILGSSLGYAVVLYLLSDLVCKAMIKHVETAGG